MVVFVLLRGSGKLGIEQKKDFFRQFQSKTVKQLIDVEEKHDSDLGSLLEGKQNTAKAEASWLDLTFKIKAWALSMAERQESWKLVVSLIIQIKLIN